MIACWLAPRIGLGQAWASVFFAIAYLAGGTFGVQAGLQSLRQWTIDVDLLMVLAALGAAAIGAPFEGAMLLSLFSLSNTLQAYAMDRTGRSIGVGSIRYFEAHGASVEGGLAQGLGALQDAGKTCVVVGEIGEDGTRILGALGIPFFMSEIPAAARRRDSV